MISGMELAYQHLALGGTFDLLHKGHKDFLRFGFLRGKRLSIGILSDEAAIKNGKRPCLLLEERIKGVKKFVGYEGYLKRTNIIVIGDIFGTTLRDKSIDGLVVTTSTIGGGRTVNRKRQEKGLFRLPLLVCPLTLASDRQTISSSRIRAGIINREGESYWQFLGEAKQYILPGGLKPKLREPLDKILKKGNLKINHPFFSVGDQTTKNLSSWGMRPDISIIDLKVGRKKIYRKIEELGLSSKLPVKIVKNQAGMIGKSLVIAIKKILRGDKVFVIRVIGEDDLAVLPLILLAPLGAFVFYGQRDKGMVAVKITEEKKREIFEILKQFIKVL